jgi:hypothetical protein
MPLCFLRQIIIHVVGLAEKQYGLENNMYNDQITGNTQHVDDSPYILRLQVHETDVGSAPHLLMLEDLARLHCPHNRSIDGVAPILVDVLDHLLLLVDWRQRDLQGIRVSAT